MHIVIEPGRTEQNYWADLWRYRELFRVLAWRDLSVRYKQTFIGVAWVVLRPLLAMVVFTIVFGRIARLPSEGGAPYALVVFAGLLPWMFFAAALSEAATSVVTNANLIGKVYFPRLIVPAAAVVVALVELLIGLVMLAALMAWFGYAPRWNVLLLPLFMALAFAAALGPGLWISALNAKYRDFRFVVPFVIQFGMYVSPVGFSTSVVPAEWRLLYSLNPMAGVIDGFRWCVLGTPIHAQGFAVSVGVVVAFLWLGLRRFRRTEKTFADLV
ncbi:MAG TPA: ABC transporter permease [Usitatibacter sp.]|nr:ABC transporter permease [Usitatibacter sp.]